MKLRKFVGKYIRNREKTQTNKQNLKVKVRYFALNAMPQRLLFMCSHVEEAGSIVGEIFLYSPSPILMHKEPTPGGDF